VRVVEKGVYAILHKRLAFLHEIGDILHQRSAFSLLQRPCGAMAQKLLIKRCEMLVTLPSIARCPILGWRGGKISKTN
jgi:hypothetical protein